MPVTMDAVAERLRIFDLAKVHTMLPQDEEAIDQLERLLELFPAPEFLRLPDLTPMREHPRFKRLQEESGSA